MELQYQICKLPQQQAPSLINSFDFIPTLRSQFMHVTKFRKLYGVLSIVWDILLITMDNSIIFWNYIHENISAKLYFPVPFLNTRGIIGEHRIFGFNGTIFLLFYGDNQTVKLAIYDVGELQVTQPDDDTDAPNELCINKWKLYDFCNYPFTCLFDMFMSSDNPWKKNILPLGHIDGDIYSMNLIAQHNQMKIDLKKCKSKNLMLKTNLFGYVIGHWIYLISNDVNIFLGACQNSIYSIKHLKNKTKIREIDLPSDLSYVIHDVHHNLINIPNATSNINNMEDTQALPPYRFPLVLSTFKVINLYDMCIMIFDSSFSRLFFMDINSMETIWEFIDVAWTSLFSQHEPDSIIFNEISGNLHFIKFNHLRKKRYDASLYPTYEKYASSVCRTYHIIIPIMKIFPTQLIQNLKSRNIDSFNVKLKYLWDNSIKKHYINIFPLDIQTIIFHFFNPMVRL